MGIEPNLTLFYLTNRLPLLRPPSPARRSVAASRRRASLRRMGKEVRRRSRRLSPAAPWSMLGQLTPLPLSPGAGRSMVTDFQREYLLRLPLPLAQLYGRAHNAKDARSRHDNAFYLFEAWIKLAAAPLAARYLCEAEVSGQRVPAMDRALAQLALPSLGQWVGILRDGARHFGQRPDAGSHPLGHVWEQLTAKHPDRPGLLALFRRIKNGPDGEPGGDVSCSLLQVLESLVQYRNGVFGHGAGRFES